MVGRVKQVEFKDPDIKKSNKLILISKIVAIVIFVIFIGYIFYGMDSSNESDTVDGLIEVTYSDKILNLNYSSEYLYDSVVVMVYGSDDGKFVGYGNLELYSETHVGNFTSSYNVDFKKINTYAISISEFYEDNKIVTWYGMRRDALGIATVYKM
jgi:hypothetical protein